MIRATAKRGERPPGGTDRVPSPGGWHRLPLLGSSGFPVQTGVNVAQRTGRQRQTACVRVLSPEPVILCPVALKIMRSLYPPLPSIYRVLSGDLVGTGVRAAPARAATTAPEGRERDSSAPARTTSTTDAAFFLTLRRPAPPFPPHRGRRPLRLDRRLPDRPATVARHRPRTGAPLRAGLVAPPSGGIVASRLGGSPSRSAAPAAGLTVVTAELIQRYG